MFFMRSMVWLAKTKQKNKHTQSIITRWPHNLSSKPGHFESDRDTINNYDGQQL